jgi:outer membrane protein assembly factor BamB
MALLAVRESVVAVADNVVDWRAPVSERVAVGPLAVTGQGDIVAGAGDGSVVHVRVDGSIAWRLDAGGPIHLSPVLAEDGTAFVAAGSTLVAIAPSGEIAWRRDLSQPILAGPLVADDGSVYVALNAGKMGGQVRALTRDGGDLRIARLPAAPSRGLALDAQGLWVGLSDLTLHRIAVPQKRLARSSWPKSRGDRGNTGSP